MNSKIKELYLYTTVTTEPRGICLAGPRRWGVRVADPIEIVFSSKAYAPKKKAVLGGVS